jgi:hypothetical protein
MQKLEREIRNLKIYSAALTICFLITLGFVLYGNYIKNPKFQEINVERINIIEKNGDLKMVISNQERQHPGILNGKVIPRKGPRGAGLLFFNHLGDETGGLQYQGNDKHGHYAGLAFDKLNHDQSIALQHIEDKDGNHQVGLRMWERPKNTVWETVDTLKKIKKIKDPNERKNAMQQARKNGLIHATRLFIGKRKNNKVELVMSDSLARPRLILKVDTDGMPSMVFLDSDGKVSHQIPQKGN